MREASSSHFDAFMPETKLPVQPSLDTSDPRPPILAVETSNATHLGVPIGLFSDQMMLMMHDGGIHFIDHASVKHQSILSERFQAIDRSELARALNEEFGRRYTVKHESPYLVVAPTSHVAEWTQRFRSIVHSYRLYCSTHKIVLRSFEFPLVAVVFGSRDEFLGYAHADEANLPANCVGYYSQKSNRILLYEMPSGDSSETIDTICHEATHQLAFNTGVHQRLASTPLWLCEGFATMFESPLVSGLSTRAGQSQWPDSRRHEWQMLKQNPDAIARLIDSLIRSDTEFKHQPQESYCVAWAMVSYLSQRHAVQFGCYIALTSNLPPFQEYATAQRQADFRSIFATDTRIMTKNLIKFVDELK
jgi:hypothetical protein